MLGSAFASVGYLFSNSMGSISLMLFLLAFVLNYKNLNFSIKKILTSPTVSLVLFFLFIIICSFYSENTNQAQKEVVRFLSFLIYPIIFTSIAPFNLKERRSIILLFIISLMLFFFICLTVSIQRQITFWNEGGHFNWYFFYRYDFLEIFNQHPTYVSLFTLLALSFLNFLPKKEAIIKNHLISACLSFILIFALILYGSRMGYLLLLVLGIVYLIKLINEKKLKHLFLILTSFSCLLITAWNIPIVKERILFSIGENYDYKYNNKEAINVGTEEQGRFLLWQDAFELIKEETFLGYGTGASRQLLLEKYEEKGHTIFLEERYNAHNTYLELLLWGGLVLLIAYLFYLGRLLHQSIVKKDLMLFLFFTIISIAGITETIFIAQGIMFAAFFYCFLNQKHFIHETN